MAPLRSVFLADMGQVPFFILALVAVYGIARSIGLSSRYGLYAVIVLGATPNFLRQIEIAYVDVMVAAFFLVALRFLLQLTKEFTVRNIFLFSLSCGLLIGTKTTALPYSVVLIVPFLWFLVMHIERHGLRSFLRCTGIFGICIFILGCYQYFKNFLLTGNPFYPLEIKIFNHVLFSGVIDKATFALGFKPYDYSLVKLLFHEGLGLQFVILFFPTILALLFLSRKRHTINFVSGYLLCLPLVLFLIYYFVLPFPCVRFFYPFLGAASVAVFYLASESKISQRIVGFIVLVCVLCSIAELAKHVELAISLSLSIICFFGILKMARLHPHLHVDVKVIVVLFCAMVVVFGLLERDYKQNEYRRYVTNSPFWSDVTPAWEWLNNHTGGDNIAYVGRPVPFPLYGSGFKNNVYYVSVNTTEPPLLHNYPHSFYSWRDYQGIWGDYRELHQNLEQPGNYRGNANYDVWYKNLSAKDTDFLFIYSLHEVLGATIFPMEEQWARSRPQIFQLAFENDSVHIYKIVKPDKKI